MKDIGPIHREEYETDIEQSEPIVIAKAPGRVHLLGEHGEAGAQLLLSGAINRYMYVACSLRKDNSLRFYASDLGERKRTTLINLKYKREDRWANYIKVAIQGFAEYGYQIKGLNFTVCGEVPQQVGLASSSAIETAAAIALRSLLNADLDDDQLLELLSKGSIAFFGREENPLDHLIAVKARKNHLMVVDEIKHDVTQVPFSLSDYKLLVTDSKVPRFSVDSELKQRNSDIRKGLELISHKKEGAKLRDYVAEDLMESMGSLPEQLRRRCLHVVQELRRVSDAEDALNKVDPLAFSKAVLHSHESLRDLYEVSCPEVDWLIKRSQEIEGVLCSRMTGQGFGGCTYTFIRDSAEEEYMQRLEDYERIFGFKPLVYEIHLAGASRLL